MHCAAFWSEDKFQTALSLPLNLNVKSIDMLLSDQTHIFALRTLPRKPAVEIFPPSFTGSPQEEVRLELEKTGAGGEIKDGGSGGVVIK